MLIFIIIAILLIAFFVHRKKTKKTKIAQVNLYTGDPKTCKSLLTLYRAKKCYNSKLFKWRIKNFFRKIFKKPLLEKPLFYSSMPVGFPYVPLTKELLFREERFAYDSVILIDEVYLLADSMCFGVEEVDTTLSEFIKLIGHELHGGAIFLNSQNVKDCHYSFKRCATSYLYITEKKSLPFFMRLTVRDLFNSDEVQITNVSSNSEEDDKSLKYIYIPKKYFKYYDCYNLSILTDNLPVNTKVIEKAETLKTDKILSIKKFVKRKKEEEKERKKQEKKSTYKAVHNEI